MVIVAAAYATQQTLLFRALTDPADISSWWGGGRGGSYVTWQGKPEAGAAWSAEGVFSRGRSFHARGHFLEIDPGRRLVQSWHADWDGMAPTEASMLFEPIEGGVMLTLVHKGFKDREQSCQAQAHMWWRVIKWLRPFVQADGVGLNQEAPALSPSKMKG
jgi:uncharacterized protein YndB with AHSA1/START domain